MSEKHHGTKDRDEKVLCICPSAGSKNSIFCDYCEKWYHFDCIGMTQQIAKRIDKYCCFKCSKKDPLLKTTYKAGKRKQKNPGRPERDINKSFKHSTPIANAVSDRVVIPFAEFFRIIGYRDRIHLNSSSSSDVENTTFQNSKSPSKEKCDFLAKLGLKSKPKVSEMKGRYMPAHAAATGRDNFHSRFDVCRKNRDKNLPAVLYRQEYHYFSTPYPTEQFQKLLKNIEENICQVQRSLEAVDIRIIQFIGEMNRGKKEGSLLGNHNNSSQVLCVLCGKHQDLSEADHFKDCFLRYERKFSITENTNMLYDVQWNVFCNFCKRVHCKNLKALCREHHNYFRKDDEVCGYPVLDFEYCGNVGKTCCHTDWEVLKRAQLDLDKANLIVKLYKLNEERKKACTKLSHTLQQHSLREIV